MGIVVYGDYANRDQASVAERLTVTTPFWTRHRGPYLLRVTRPVTTKPGFFRSEPLIGKTFTGEEAESEALALLTDPRDTICNVAVWSEREEQCVMSYEKTT